MIVDLQLESPSYSAEELKNWADENEFNNEIAQRLKTKYFNGKANFNRSSLYTVVLTNNGGVILRKALQSKNGTRVRAS